MKICVLGAGAMGTACAIHLAKHCGHHVTLWARRAEQAARLRAEHTNAQYLPDVRVPSEVVITCHAVEALADAELVIAAVPTVHLRSVLEVVAPQFQKRPPILSVAKGIEQGTLLRPTEIIRQVLGPGPVAALCGPCHAEEFAVGLPCSVVVASTPPEAAVAIQSTLTSERFRAYTNDDLLGAELAAALKNVVALAAGACDGLRLGDNAKSALIARGLAELVRFGSAFGGKPKTFYGLAGVGDLMTTCWSRHSRNRRLGERIGQGETLQEILACTQTVAEGVWTSRAVNQQATAVGVDLPITSEVVQVLFHGKNPAESVSDLMERSLKSEW